MCNICCKTQKFSCRFPKNYNYLSCEASPTIMKEVMDLLTGELILFFLPLDPSKDCINHFNIKSWSYAKCLQWNQNHITNLESSMGLVNACNPFVKSALREVRLYGYEKWYMGLSWNYGKQNSWLSFMLHALSSFQPENYAKLKAWKFLWINTGKCTEKLFPWFLRA